MNLGTGRLEPGAVFAGCRIEHLIGQGGMGSVYLARQLELDRLVALKIVSPALAGDRGFVDRFRSETRVAAQVEHPNVVPLYVAGEEGGVLFMLMRYVAGRDLGALLAAKGRLAPARAAALVAQTAAGLDAVHSAGLVHRDLKPANVLVTGDEQDEHAYLTDFGLAKRAASLSGPTMTGQFVGTLDYVAPEQLTAGRVDARADVYALGCLLFQLLTGEVPYPRDDSAATMWAHVNAAPPAPSERGGAELERFDEVVARALAKEPDQRFPSAGDLGRAAATALAGQAPGATERSVATGLAAPATTKVGRPPTVPSPQGPAETRAQAPAPTRASTRRGRPSRRGVLAGMLAVGVLSAAGALAVSGVFAGEADVPDPSPPAPPASGPVGELTPRGIGEVEIGDSQAEVEAAFGPPDDREELLQRDLPGDEGLPFTVWNYEISDQDPSEDSLRLYFDFGSDELTGYSSVTDQLETDRGITTGEDLVQLRASYGDDLIKGPGGFQTAASFIVREDESKRYPVIIFGVQLGDVGAIEGGDPPPNLGYGFRVISP